jgi:hypothetical protein
VSSCWRASSPPAGAETCAEVRKSESLPPAPVRLSDMGLAPGAGASLRKSSSLDLRFSSLAAMACLSSGAAAATGGWNESSEA